MDRKAILYSIYRILMKKEEGAMTMDELSKQLKCSKKSLYKLFPSKKAMLFEVFSLYKKHLMGLLNDISLLERSETQKLVYQIKELHINSAVFFNSHLYNQLKSIPGFDSVLIKAERGVYSVGFKRITDNIEASGSQKEKLINILIFIGIAIKRRFMLPNPQENITDGQFLDMMLTLLFAYIKKEHIERNGSMDNPHLALSISYQEKAGKIAV